MLREAFYMPATRAFNLNLWVHGSAGKPSMHLPSATGSVASLGYMDAQGNLLCLSRAPPGPLLALWDTWIRRETVYADL